MIGQKEKALSYKEYCEKLRDVASRLKECQHELADAEQEAGKLERGGTDISPLKELREKAITAQSALKPFAEEAEALSSLKDSARKGLYNAQKFVTKDSTHSTSFKLFRTVRKIKAKYHTHQLEKKLKGEKEEKTEQPENADLYAQLIENTENELHNLAESPNQLFIPLPERLKQYESALEKAQSVLHDFQDELSKLNDEKSEEILKKGLCVSLQEPEPPQTSFRAAMDFLNKLLSDYTAVLGVLLTIGTIFISAAMYLYRQGYLSYFNIGEEWNNYTDKSMFYTLAFPFCLAVLGIVSFSVIMSPIAMKISYIWKCFYLVIADIIFLIILLILSGSYNQIVKTVSSIIALLIVVIMLFISLEQINHYTPKAKSENRVDFFLIYPLLMPIIACGTVIIIYCRLSGEKQSQNPSFIPFAISTTLLLILFKYAYALFIDDIQTEYQLKTSPQKASAILIVVVLFAASALGALSYYDGYTKAKLEKSISILYANESETDSNTAPAQSFQKMLSDEAVTKEGTIIDVVLAEKGDQYLVAKGILYEDNRVILLTNYYTVKEKQDQFILRLNVNKIELKEVTP